MDDIVFTYFANGQQNVGHYLNSEQLRENSSETLARQHCFQITSPFKLETMRRAFFMKIFSFAVNETK